MSMNSPKKKKARLTPESTTIQLKREVEMEETSNKRIKSETSFKEDLQAKKRKNFVAACEQVSYKAYFDHSSRFQLIYLPTCIDSSTCNHHDLTKVGYIKQMPPYAEESFNIEIKTNMWYEALEVCLMSITADQYLSANVLQGVVEIMLNAHEDDFAGYSISYLIDKCQQILAQNFSAHPPCLVKSLRKCYNNFLTQPMDLKENTFTNRTNFGCEKGIVGYCMNRLEYEMSSDSKDEPLVDKYENIPEEMKQSVKGLHWQKEKFEIFELLDRPDRIERLMAVLESIIELLQFDLAIWHSRYTNNLGRHIMRSDKPLMAYILWSHNILFTGAVNFNCRQILRLFVNLIHLEYPEEYIKIIARWVNTMIQTFYICETNSNSDYPNIGKYCTAFAKEFYKIIGEMPNETIIKILEWIQPNYMQYLLGTLHIRTLLSTEEDCVIKVLINFIEHSQWNNFPETNDKIILSKKKFISPKRIKRISNYLSKKCKTFVKMPRVGNIDRRFCPKLTMSSKINDSVISRNYIIHTLYITLEAYLDAHNVQSVQDTLDTLNEQLLQNELETESTLPGFGSYSVTEQFIKKYRSIYQMLKELVLRLHEMKNSGNLPDVLKIFENIGLEL